MTEWRMTSLTRPSTITTMEILTYHIVRPFLQQAWQPGHQYNFKYVMAELSFMPPQHHPSLPLGGYDYQLQEQTATEFADSF